ncbi:DNA sulfur modification protein DndB [Paenibacillus sp. LK1]|uniref:DNA sulfur modification protein DndB n=1 Tax=Paenibacillus sp. LK1 TaxID=2053014 RepID=UPI000C19BDE2|nr:DNA sulfur modification protein DndB [Paenibacillus sp. LK1]PIH59113.1 hypothetical protein CS562_14330 [Paenibacillus sp. LK1]
MQIDRKEIEIRIIKSLNLVKKSRKSLNELNVFLSELNVPYGMVESILANEEIISEVDIPLLVGISIAVYKLTKDRDLHTETLFGDREVRDALDILGQTISEKIYLPIPLNDVIKIKYDSFVTKISIKELVKMFESQLIIYDYETQRGAKYKTNASGGIVKTPIVNKASVKRISKKMADNDYLEDMIVLNVYSTEIEPVTYHEETRTLTINDGAIISILDGFHRLQGALAALEINPNADLVEILSVRTYDHETAQKFFGQINTINVLKTERRKELAQERMSDKVVANLQRKSEIGKRIASSSQVSIPAGELTTFDILSYTIDKVFPLKIQFDVLETSDYLVDFFAYLVGKYPDEFSLKAKESTNSVMRHPLMFIGYIVLSKYMQEQDINLRDLNKMINQIDFDDEKLIGMLSTKGIRGNNLARNNLISYFESIFRGVK